MVSPRYLGRFALLVLGFVSSVLAVFDPTSTANVAVYWGQNSFGQATSQQRLSSYCANTKFNILPIAFLVGINPPAVNFANAGDNCTDVSQGLLGKCPQIEADIKKCQTTCIKTILLSIGGATYTEGGFRSDTDAVAAAQNIWNLFGPNTQTAKCPFGSAVVDGFDFDIEAPARFMAPFAQELRSLMDADKSRRYYLAAAPQCPFPDQNIGGLLDAVAMDFVMLQFYNNYCGVAKFAPGAAAQTAFNMAQWDDWAKRTSPNQGVKVLLGVAANTRAANAGEYIPASALKPVIEYSRTFDSFGGVMMWDMSQMTANTGFLRSIAAALGPGPVPSSTWQTTGTIRPSRKSASWSVSTTSVTRSAGPTTAQAATITTTTTATVYVTRTSAGNASPPSSAPDSQPVAQ